MSFWSDLYDNAAVIGAAATDAVDVRNWLTGEAPNTARIVEQQVAEREGREVDQGRIDRSTEGGLERIREAGVATIDDVAERAQNAGTFLGTYGPWIVGGVALLALGVVALPYVSAAKELAK